jgi:hypothetical protein
MILGHQNFSRICWLRTHIRSLANVHRSQRLRRTASADARARRVRNLHGYLSVDHAPPLDQVRRPMRKPIRAARIVSARMCMRLQREGSISGRRPNRRPKGRTKPASPDINPTERICSKVRRRPDLPAIYGWAARHRATAQMMATDHHVSRRNS